MANALLEVAPLRGSPGIQIAQASFLEGARPCGAIVAGIREGGGISLWNRNAPLERRVLVGDRIVSLDGQNVEFVPTEDIRALLKSKVLQESAFGIGVLHNRGTSEGKVDEEDEDAEAEIALQMRLQDENIIVANNIHKTYLLGVEGVPALRGVSMTIKRGEFAMLLGKSGGGKTSLLNVLGTIDKPTKGEVTICGQRITSATKDSEFAQLRLQHIGFVFQTFNLISSMTAVENVSLPMILAGKLSAKQIRERAVDLLTRVGMGGRLDHLPSQLSGGEQQRVTISRSLANRPDILLLDEPTGDLDTHNSEIIMNLLVELNRKEKITCIMVTHDQELKKYSHRVFHMMDGKLFRIEHIPEQAREEADAALRACVQEHESLKQSRALDRPLELEVRDPVQAYRYNHLHTFLKAGEPSPSSAHY